MATPRNERRRRVRKQNDMPAKPYAWVQKHSCTCTMYCHGTARRVGGICERCASEPMEKELCFVETFPCHCQLYCNKSCETHCSCETRRGYCLVSCHVRTRATPPPCIAASDHEVYRKVRAQYEDNERLRKQRLDRAREERQCRAIEAVKHAENELAKAQNNHNKTTSTLWARIFDRRQ